jgi:hypothetical protein
MTAGNGCRRLMRTVLVLLPLLAGAGCASGKPSNNPSQAGKGFRVVEAIVVERIFEPPGSAGTSLAGAGSWSLGFEAKDGEATVHYRFPVTRDQYNRYQEGDRVQLVMADDRLREIRPAR